MSPRTEPVLWLFDVGNSRLKGRWSRGDESGPPFGIDWGTPGPGRRLGKELTAWPLPRRILVASVAPAHRAGILLRALRRWPQVRAEWLSSPRRACGITNAYRIPERLGIDRFLAMAGARAATRGRPFVLVGCGTALTLDAVDADGRQGAGLIAPSPGLMVGALRGRTAIGETNPRAFGEHADVDDTHVAIEAGCWRAATALVGSFHASSRSGIGDAVLLLHGGGAPQLKSALDAGGCVDAHLSADVVWRGLRIWAATRPRPPSRRIE